MAKKSKSSVGKPARTAVLVLGMHRSGTSALAGVLSKLGCALPNALMEASPANAKGFFESTAVRDLNDEILASAGSSWDDFLPFNPNWLDSPIASDFLARAADLVDRDFGKAPLFVLKDPRICRMVPFWTRVLEEVGCTIRPILTVRNPNEVARSLRQKKGFTGPLSQMIWLRHVLDAESQTRSMQRYNTSYEMLVRRWPQVTAEAERSLDLHWPRGISQAEIAIDGLLSSDLRHHQERTEDVVDNPLLVDWLRDSYAIFTRWAETGEDAQNYATLDAIRAAFDESGRAFSRLVQAEREERRLLTERLTELKTEKASLEGSVAQYANAKVDDSRKLRQVEAQAEAAQEALKKREAETAQFGELSADLTKKIASIKQLQAKVAVLENDLAAAQENREALEKQEADAARLAEVSAELTKRIASSKQLQAKLATLEADLAAAQENREALEAALTKAGKQAAQDEASLASRDQSLATLGEEAQRLAQALEAAKAEGEQRAQEIAALSIAIVASDKEMARLNAEGHERVREIATLTEALAAAATEGEARAQEIAMLSMAMVTRDKELGQLNADLSDAETRDEARLAELDALKNELSQVQSALVQRQHESETTAAALNETRAELMRETAVVARYAAEIEEARAEQQQARENLQDRFREIATLTQFSMKQQGALDTLQGEAATLTEKMRDAQGAQESLGTQSAQLVNELASVKVELSGLRYDLADLTQERDGLARELQALRASSSWRLTGPLRRIVRLVRRR